MVVGNEEMQVVIVGLGNPGREYALTRHNIGFLTVRAFAAKQGLGFKEEKRFFCEVAKGIVDGVKVHLLMPQTYMNDSGKAVRAYLEYYHLSSKNLIVVSDDVDLPCGMLRVRDSGSAGGHNGLKSIEAAIGTPRYVRMRMGVGSKLLQQELADHVLGRFSAQEMEQQPAFIDEGVKVLTLLLREEVPKVMNVVNAKVRKETPHEAQEI